MSSNASMMRWYPDREPDPRPIHGWDARIDPNVKANITFQETDDREAALAWLESRTDLGEPEPERLSMEEAERVRHRIAELPDGSINIVGGQWTEPPEPGLYSPPINPSNFIERPDFPRGPHPGVESVRIIVRMESGIGETFEIDNPSEVQFTMNVETDYMDIGLDSGRLCRMPGLRELRELVISIGSPRNWRRLPTRRWQ